MRHFSSDATTSASQATIWAIWADVSNWHTWDTELQSATLNGDFVLGAHGTLKPKSGPESHFKITELTEGKSFTFTVDLPLAKLDVAHVFREGDATTFAHEVTFRGSLGWLFGRVLGGTYAKALPEVLANITRIAEPPSVSILS